MTAALAHALPSDRLVLVDAPNPALALGVNNPIRREGRFGGKVAEYVGGEFDPKICPFGAIRENGRVFEILCDGCGVCVKNFPDSYRIKNVKNADVLEYRWGELPLITAELESGRSGSEKIITKMRRRTEAEKRDVMLVDAAAGIGCPVISSVRGADIAILVIDGTPTGASDAERVADVLNHFQIPFFFVVNRWDLAPKQGKEIIREFAEMGGENIGRYRTFKSLC